MGYGSCPYGARLYGADFCSVNGLGSVADTKPDTVFYSTSDSGTLAVLATDLSQHGVDFTADTTWIYSADAEARFTPRDRFAFEGRFDMDNSGGTEVMFAIRDEVGNANILRLFRFGSSILRLEINGVSITAVSLTGLAASPRAVQCMVSATPNPKTTGASDAVCYELVVHEEFNGEEHYIAMFAPVLDTPANYRVIFNAGTTTGGDPNGNDFYMARYGRSFHSPTEFWEDWVTKTTPGASDVRNGFVPALPDRNQIAIADEGDFSGPAYLASSQTTRPLSYYTVGPGLNYMTENPHFWSVTEFADEGMWFDTFGTGFKNAPTYVWSTVPPPHVNRWRFTGKIIIATISASPTILSVHMMAFGRWLSGKGSDGALEPITSDPLVVSSFAATTTVTNDAKQWYSIPTSADGRVYFALGVQFTEGNALDTFRLPELGIEWGHAEQTTITGVGGG